MATDGVSDVTDMAARSYPLHLLCEAIRCQFCSVNSTRVFVYDYPTIRFFKEWCKIDLKGNTL